MSVRVFLPLLVSFASLLSAQTAVSYPSPHGRFGDQLTLYLHAKWISYRDGIPLLYKPFLFSDAFALHSIETPWTKEVEARFDQVLVCEGDQQFSQDSTLYLIPYFSECQEDRVFHPDWIRIPVDWNDLGWKAVLEQVLAPSEEYPSLIPKGFEGITVALHVRRGGGFDPVMAYQLWPLRMPPDSYYIEALQIICGLFPETPIYAHLFTDEPDPASLARLYAEHLSGYPISFGFREFGNRHDANQMADFFGLFAFDCLIRSVSNFTLVHNIIGKYRVVISPKHVLWRYRQPPVKNHYLENYIDEIDVQIR